MISAWYMQFTKGDTGALDRVVGLPTHLPLEWPTVDGRPLSFLAQFACHPERLRIPDTFAIQVYLDDPSLGLPDPHVVKLPLNAPRNESQFGTACEHATLHEVTWSHREDPDEEEVDEDDMHLCQSKLWGSPYFSDILPSGHRLLLHLNEAPAGFNFGGDELMLAIDDQFNIVWVAA